MNEKPAKQDWHYCHECQVKRGGKAPDHGARGVTMMGGICSMCKQKKTLIPNDDYNWPHKKAAWD